MEEKQSNKENQKLSNYFQTTINNKQSIHSIPKANSYALSDKNLKEIYEKFLKNCDKFSWRLWSKYKNHTLSEKIWFLFFVNVPFVSLLSLVYWRNKCYFKFSRVIYRKYCLTYLALVCFYAVSSICLIFTKDDAKEQLRRYIFSYRRLYTREWEYLKKPKSEI